MFDYIIIGGGSAGCVMASRLCESPDKRILLLEAGPKPRSLWVTMPSGVGRLIHPGTHNWGYSTEPEPTMANRSIYVPRGRGLGGSSLINGMAYVRGHAEDYDDWRQFGNRNWGWDDVLPYFKKSQHRDGKPGKHHVKGGKLWVSDPQVRHPASRDFVAAGVAIGLPENEDINGDRQEGIGFLQFTIRKGRRHSTSAAFLADAAARPNLVIATGATVHRVRVENGRATGVEYSQDGQTRFAKAGVEVILSAGAIESPKVLMLSGIGPAEALQTHGIEVVKDLPGVGRNLQDHMYIHYICDSTAPSSINRDLRGLRVYAHGAYYLLTRRGILTMGASQACAWVRVMPGTDRPDTQIFFRPVSWEFGPMGTMEIGRTPAVSASCSPLRPQSRGSITLRSAEPQDRPKIAANYLDAFADRLTAVEGLKTMRRIFASEPLKSRILRETKPGPDYRSDDELLDYIRQTAQSQHHWAGTCKMGSDPMAVVDDRLRVHGVRGLRVVDASVMPQITSGNTNAPTIMIAEKAADFIKDRAA